MSTDEIKKLEEKMNAISDQIEALSAQSDELSDQHFTLTQKNHETNGLYWYADKNYFDDPVCWYEKLDDMCDMCDTSCIVKIHAKIVPLSKKDQKEIKDYNEDE